VKTYLTNFRDGLLAGRYNAALVAFLFAAVFVMLPQAAWAQSNPTGDPFAQAIEGANQVRDRLKSFALIVGGIGMVSCLLLGFFGKLNWKWVATGIGVSFALAIVPTAIGWLDSIGGGNG
jgi:hypothetical protein